MVVYPPDKVSCNLIRCQLLLPYSKSASTIVRGCCNKHCNNTHCRPTGHSSSCMHSLVTLTVLWSFAAAVSRYACYLRS